jgi:predicted PurR-regulated permease PerM
LIAPQKTETIENLVVRIKNYSEKDREKFDIFIRNSVKNKDAAYKNIENLAEKNENFNQYVQKTIK